MKLKIKRVDKDLTKNVYRKVWKSQAHKYKTLRQKRYEHYRQQQPKKYIQTSFKTIPLNYTNYKGKKFKRFKRKGTSAKARVGKLKKSNKWSIQSILIKKRS